MPLSDTSATTKNPAVSRVQSQFASNESACCLLDVRCLLALRPLHDLEVDLLAFLERLEAVHLYGREMGEQILSAFIGRDESVAFRVVEPFDRTCRHHFPSLLSSLARARSKSLATFRAPPLPHKLTSASFRVDFTRKKVPV